MSSAPEHLRAEVDRLRNENEALQIAIASATDLVRTRLSSSVDNNATTAADKLSREEVHQTAVSQHSVAEAPAGLSTSSHCAESCQMEDAISAGWDQSRFQAT